MTETFNPFSLQDKNILITGASSGIGRQCAVDCSKVGANVILFGRNESRLAETISLMKKGNHLYVSCELTESSILSDTISNVVAQVGRIDGIVNCAGISSILPLKLITQTKLEEAFKVNVFSAIEITREATKKKNINPKGASIVFISSIMAVRGEKAKTLYGMTKGALLSASKSLALELAPRNIRVNCISPGAILTPINANLPHMTDPEKREKLESHHPLGLGATSDISNACIFLLSNASRWITGQNIIIDGGYTCI